jgi:hypothetical protein
MAKFPKATNAIRQGFEYTIGHDQSLHILKFVQRFWKASYWQAGGIEVP